jgi:hypothetical protein
MRTLISSLRAPIVGLATILLAACAGQPQLSAPAELIQQRQQAIANLAGPRYVYISDLYGNFVDEFDRSGNIAAKITSGINGPVGLYVDASHNLWVANALAGNVLMFAEGATTSSRTLQDTGVPVDVTVGADGTVYVANGLDANGPGSILVYPPGHNKASRLLQDPTMAQNNFITIDPKGNLFVTTSLSGLHQFVGRVDEYIGAKQGGLRNFNIRLGSPGGIKWRNGMIYVCDTLEHTVTEYTETGRPTGRKLVTGGAWDDIDLSSDGSTILGADQAFNQGITRNFPRGKIGATYADPLFQSPGGAAFQTDEKGF